ncbi:uncharacterized protein LOC117344382 [Pecten maximus]|uniref:uncharacterized protein LOC117344382 n=1 Tax=Pecten maximus TaxID=6579 RepID=UPI001458013D|nr:uncharacterized protein LOC117344382 [Pecten maximus]
MKMPSTNIVITDVILEPPSPQKFRSGSPSKRSRWLKKEKSREEKPVSYRIQKVFNILERQGLAMPMDVRCQNDVNYQIYRSLSTLGIEEVLYPLPRDNSLQELHTIPLHHFWSEESAHDLYRENLTSGERVDPKPHERRRSTTQKRSNIRDEMSKSLDVGCRRSKRDVGPGKGNIARRRQKACVERRCVRIPDQWNDRCILPGNVPRYNLIREAQEYYKEADNQNGRTFKTVSIADNYDTTEISGLDSCLPLSWKVDKRIEILLSKQELSLPIQVLPETPRSKMTSNPKYTRHEKESYYVVGSQEQIAARDIDMQSEVYNNLKHLKRDQNRLQKPQKDSIECLVDDARLSRNARLSEKAFQLDIDHVHDVVSDDDSKLLVEKRCSEAKGNTALDENQTEKITDQSHHKNKDLIESDMVTLVEELQTDVCLEQASVLEERSSACSSRSAEDFCEISTGRRVSWASDLERDTRGSHSRNSISRSSRDKAKIKRSSRKQTPVIMYSESECSLLCQKYIN